MSNSERTYKDLQDEIQALDDEHLDGLYAVLTVMRNQAYEMCTESSIPPVLLMCAFLADAQMLRDTVADNKHLQVKQDLVDWVVDSYMNRPFVMEAMKAIRFDNQAAQQSNVIITGEA